MFLLMFHRFTFGSWGCSRLRPVLGAALACASPLEVALACTVGLEPFAPSGGWISPSVVLSGVLVCVCFACGSWFVVIAFATTIGLWSCAENGSLVFGLELACSNKTETAIIIIDYSKLIRNILSSNGVDK